jgi:energy-coupling factor transporter transmembrane protein EcfT
VVHQLPSHLKILAALLFIFVGVATPITNWPAFLLYFLTIIIAATAAKIPLGTLFSRAVIEIPFIFFAILMPFFGKGDQVSVGPFTLYVDGIEDESLRYVSAWSGDSDGITTLAVPIDLGPSYVLPAGDYADELYIDGAIQGSRMLFKVTE